MQIEKKIEISVKEKGAQWPSQPNRPSHPSRPAHQPHPQLGRPGETAQLRRPPASDPDKWTPAFRSLTNGAHMSGFPFPSLFQSDRTGGARRVVSRRAVPPCCVPSRRAEREDRIKALTAHGLVGPGSRE